MKLGSHKKRNHPVVQGTHNIEEQLDSKMVAFTTNLDLLQKIMSAYGNDINRIPPLFKEGFLNLRKQVESDFALVLKESKQNPFNVLSQQGEVQTRAAILNAKDTIEKKQQEKRGDDVEPTLVSDLYDQDKSWFTDHF